MCQRKIKIDKHLKAKTNQCEHIFVPNTVILETIGCIHNPFISTNQKSVYIRAGTENIKASFFRLKIVSEDFSNAKFNFMDLKNANIFIVAQ